MNGHDLIILGVYSRVSSPRQAKEGHSLDTQLDYSRQKADIMFGEGQYVIREYIEPGLSGSYPPAQMLGRGMGPRQTRQALTRLLDDADKGELDFVFFFEVNRAARDEEIHFFVHRWLAEREIGFRFLDVDVDPTTDDGMLVTGMLGLMAAHFRRAHRRRIKQAWRARFAEGYPPGGPAPFGFDRQSGEDVPRGGRPGYVRNEEQAQWVRWMFDHYQAGWTTTRIADELTRLGVPRARGELRRWDSSAVRKILLHPVYAGLLETQDGELIEAQWFDDRMWDPDERRLIVKRLQRNRRLGSQTVSKAEYIVNGILTCGHCGKRLYAARTPGGRRQYMCRGTDGACSGLQKVAEPVEEAVVRVVRELASSRDVRALAAEQVGEILSGEASQLEKQLAGLEQQANGVQRRIDSLTDMRANGELTQDEFVQQKGRMAHEKADLEAQASAVRDELEAQSVREAELAQIETVLADFDRVWDALDHQERHEALLTVVQRAEVHRVGDDDLELRLKVHYLPERVLPLPSYIRRGAPEGVEALTARELAWLKHRTDGLDDDEIADLFDVDTTSIRTLRESAMARLEVTSVEQAADLAAERMEAELHMLPLRGRMNMRVNDRPKFTWTDKRKAILRGLASGLPREEIAGAQAIEKKTLDNRIGRMKQQAGVTEDDELAAWAIDNGVIEPPA